MAPAYDDSTAEPGSSSREMQKKIPENPLPRAGIDRVVRYRFDSDTDEESLDLEDEPIPKSHMDAALYNICLEGIVDEFDEMLAKVPDIALQKTTYGANVLHLAAERGRNQLAAHIMTLYPELVSGKDDMGNLPIHEAAAGDHLIIVQALVEHCQNRHQGVTNQLKDFLTEKNGNGNTALHLSLENAHPDVSQFLLSINVDIRYGANEDGKTPLYIAAERGYQWLIYSFPQSTLKDLNELHAVYGALASKNTEVLRLILRKHPISLPLFDRKGKTPLSVAAFSEFYGGVNELLLLGATLPDIVCSPDKDLSYPIHRACRTGNIDIVKGILLQFPDAAFLLDIHDRSFLHIAAKKGHENIVKYVLESPWLYRLLKMKDARGNTVLHTATMSWCPEIVRLLTRDKQVRLDTLNEDGHTALDMAELMVKPEQLPGLRQILTWDSLDAAKAPRVNGVRRPHRFHIPYEREGLLITAMMTIAVLVCGASYSSYYTIPGGFETEKGDRKGVAILIDRKEFIAFSILNPSSFFLSFVAGILFLMCFVSDEKLMMYFGRLGGNLLLVGLICFLGGILTGLPTYIHGPLAAIGVAWYIRALSALCIVFVFFVQLLLFYPDPTSGGLVSRILGWVSLELKLWYYKNQKKLMKNYLKKTYLH